MSKKFFEETITYLSALSAQEAVERKEEDTVQKSWLRPMPHNMKKWKPQFISARSAIVGISSAAFLNVNNCGSLFVNFQRIFPLTKFAKRGIITEQMFVKGHLHLCRIKIFL